jgi:hypothetical protein
MSDDLLDTVLARPRTRAEMRPKPYFFVVPFSPEDAHPISALSIIEAVDALEEACQFRHLDAKNFSVAMLQLPKKRVLTN